MCEVLCGPVLVAVFIPLDEEIHRGADPCVFVMPTEAFATVFIWTCLVFFAPLAQSRGHLPPVGMPECGVSKCCQDVKAIVGFLQCFSRISWMVVSTWISQRKIVSCQALILLLPLLYLLHLSYPTAQRPRGRARLPTSRWVGHHASFARGPQEPRGTLSDGVCYSAHAQADHGATCAKVAVWCVRPRLDEPCVPLRCFIASLVMFCRGLLPLRVYIIVFRKRGT